MGQRAFVPCYSYVRGTPNVGEMFLEFPVLFVEENTEAPATFQVQVLTQWSDNLNQIQTKVKDAILAIAAENGWIGITAADMILPAIVKG